ncbi:MAG: hypothetical protein B7X11_01940, partial [Acidobacteria bacterium 37-65-4]
AMRQPRSWRGPVVAMIHTAVALFIMQIFVGAAQIFTSLADWAVALHVALAAGVPLVDAARLANAAAGVVVGKTGTAICTAQELAEALRVAP